jgi:hypothetical protein
MASQSVDPAEIRVRALFLRSGSQSELSLTHDQMGIDLRMIRERAHRKAAMPWSAMDEGSDTGEKSITSPSRTAQANSITSFPAVS